jgi:hypothetical protein
MKSIVNIPNDDDGCRAVAHAADEKSEVRTLDAKLMKKRRRQCSPSLSMAEAELGVAGGLVNGDRDHDCKLLLNLAFVRLFQQEFQKKNLTTNEVLYFTAMEIASENVCLIFLSTSLINDLEETVRRFSPNRLC